MIACLLALTAVSPLWAAPKTNSSISLGPNGRLVYAADQHGNRIPDFSHCGYAGGDRPIPLAPVRVVVSPAQGDSTARIQAAIDYVAGLPADTNGVRGAVLLLKGRHEIAGGLRLKFSGVVLRGQGMGPDGTVLIAAGRDRRTLLEIAGRNNRTIVTNQSWEIKDDYVPVGATSFRLQDTTGLKQGDIVLVVRPSTKTWIDRLGMTEFGGGIGDWRLVWKPGSRDLVWDRVITGLDGDRVTVDAPITTAMETGFGGGRVEAYAWPGRIANVGVENLRLESTFDATNPKDENHAWMAITVENAENVWVRQVTGIHFASSLVAIWESCKWVTVQDCLWLAPVSEEGGYRRHSFFTLGQMTLFLRCWAEHGWHDFSAGHCAAGPNAFVQCESGFALRDSGPIESWASGVLYDNVRIDGNGLGLANRGSEGQGAGWAAANSVLWQCSASVIRCENPPTARNWALGCWGEFEGDGLWRDSNAAVKPESLYVAQVTDRLGPEAASRIPFMRRSAEERTNPTIEEAAELIAAARKPAPQLADYIAAAPTREPIPREPGDAKPVEEVQATENSKLNSQNPKLKAQNSKLILTNGWLVCEGRLLIGGSSGVSWWRGNVRPSEAPSFGQCLTRFVPGRTGTGYTDDLEEVADWMSAKGFAALDHHYGLWYERRRDDHERVRRIDGDVWPPFYEMPFARTGQGTAWNGLSLYDLTQFNPWYWDRLKQFAEICGRRGLVLFHENYFQHNILEAGAHWADCPWRSANNINNTGFPEPPPYAGDKRIFMAEQFYDVTHPVRRALHRSYIRQCLDNFAKDSNVIQFASAEYTGPLEFVQFWLDTIAAWEKETGHKPLVALSCPKDVQDAILADPKRSPVVDVICFRYWWVTEKGTFAPKGGQNLAPRQFERQWKGGSPSDMNLARMAAEYKERFHDKAVIASGEDANLSQCSWAFLCAGGSMPNLPRTTDQRLLAALPRMTPWPAASATNRWVLREPGHQYIIYLGSQASAQFDLSQEKETFTAYVINTRTGELKQLTEPIRAAANVTLPVDGSRPTVLWLIRQG